MTEEHGIAASGPEGRIAIGPEMRRGWVAVSPRRGSWSRKYDQCQECGTTSLPHAGHGLCRNCYMRHYMRLYTSKRAGMLPMGMDGAGY